MPYKTVNVKPATYERLRMYQTGGKSMGDVIDDLMDTVEPERHYALELKIARKRIEEMKTKGIGMTLEDLDEKLDRERKRAGSATSWKQSQTRTRPDPDRARVHRPRAPPRVEGA